jgi:hypothetical protein
MLKVNPDDFRSPLPQNLPNCCLGTNSVEASPEARVQVPLLICEIQSEKVAVASTARLAIKKRTSFRCG